jgi:DNA (cytosine-5)-methyltransferase 1
MSRAYYNDTDPYVCAWLRNLIAAGLIAPGDVDERSILEVRADDIAGYSQCHFFAGAGGWSIALRLAGWPDERPCWTGSCPCQPLSGAGLRRGHADERHLWPAFHALIAECQPAVVLGEQVGGALGLEWLAGVRVDLEGSGYACGCANLPACGVGAPHRRERLWFVADADLTAIRDSGHGAAEAAPPGMRGADGERQRLRADPVADGGTVADTEDGDGGGRKWDAQARVGQDQERRWRSSSGGAGAVGDTSSARLSASEREAVERAGRRQEGRAAAESGGSFWAGAGWLTGSDGKARRAEPGVRLLAHGIPARASKLRAYGNSIVPQAAAAFIGAFMEVTAGSRGGG